MDGYKRVASVMKALAHPVRLQILEALKEEGEACVCHLESMLNLRQAYVSQQLSRLREAGLVVDRRDSLNVFYSLADETLLRLLDVARESAVDLARLEGQQLNFRTLEHRSSAPCPCPKCATSVGMMASV